MFEGRFDAESLLQEEPADGVSRRASLKWDPFSPLRPPRTDVLLFSRVGQASVETYSRIYGHRARTKSGKPHALCNIVRHRSRKKKRLDAILPHARSPRGPEDLFENNTKNILISRYMR